MKGWYKYGNINTSRTSKFKASYKYARYFIPKTKCLCFTMCRSANKADVHKSCTGLTKYKTEVINIFELGGSKVEEKYMVNDILQGVKSELTTYQGVITETEDMRIKTGYSGDKR